MVRRLLCRTNSRKQVGKMLARCRQARNPKCRMRTKPFNQIKKLAEDVGQLPRLKRSPDPGDNYLLALAEAGRADYLVTGDKSGLLVLTRHKSARIITARAFVAFFVADAP